jgi:RNA polymerase sigma factor (sigma-70 family)
MAAAYVAVVGATADERLVELSRDGNETAFDAIVERYEPLLLRHCTRMLDRAAAQDAVQDTFLIAWTALRVGAEVRALRAWLFTIAHRKALNALRDRRRTWAQLPESLTHGYSSADTADQFARMCDVLAAVAELPEDQREALVRSAVHGGSGQQVARALGVDEPTVRQLVHRARANVREAAAACLVPPALLARLARRAGHATSRVCGRVVINPAQTAATARLLKIGATAVVSIALVGSGTLRVITLGHHAPPIAHASQKPDPDHADVPARAPRVISIPDASGTPASTAEHATHAPDPPASVTSRLASSVAAAPASKPLRPTGALARDIVPSVVATTTQQLTPTLQSTAANTTKAVQTVVEPTLTPATHTLTTAVSGLAAVGQTDPAGGSTGSLRVVANAVPGL